MAMDTASPLTCRAVLAGVMGGFVVPIAGGSADRSASVAAVRGRRRRLAADPAVTSQADDGVYLFLYLPRHGPQGPGPTARG